jgi:hypothetical protein
MIEEISKISKIVVAVAVSIFILAYILFAFWQHLAENISLKLRKIYIKALFN